MELNPKVNHKPCENPKKCAEKMRLRIGVPAADSNPFPGRNQTFWECPDCGFSSPSQTDHYRAGR